LLGAGLDARAWRLPALRDATVFEVDHPATQRVKRSRVDALRARAKEVRFVSVDFERQPLAARLAEEGHDATRPSFWIWEGVVPYLDPRASRATLEAVLSRSAPGSAIAVTYAVAEDRLWLTRLRDAVHIGFRILGEPLRGLTTTDAFHQTLRETGWSVGDDTGPLDWRARYGYGVKALLSIEERLAVATVPAQAA
jgi:methyltransferase (TIGR00027 family)